MSELGFPRRMLLATDGSPHSLDAAKRAAQIAKTSKSEIIVAHVLHPFTHPTVPPGPMEIGGQISVDTEKDIKERGDQVMAATRKIFDTLSVKVTTIFLVGDATRAIIDEATKESVDLIVVGACGHGGTTGWLLGSVAEKIARYAPCPVMIVR